jgi:hypothetical protein
MMIRMTPHLAEELASVFRPYDIGFLLVASFGIMLVIGAVIILWYSYASRYVFEKA